MTSGQREVIYDSPQLREVLESFPHLKESLVGYFAQKLIKSFAFLYQALTYLKQALT